jgi:TPP-dependent 2-oxoacid decarboxylase
MSKNLIEEITIHLHGTNKGVISIAKIEEPYGKESDTVVSIGVSLTGMADEPDWKIHIPLENLAEVIDALQKLN